MTVDLSNLSDDDLYKIAGVGKNQTQQTTANQTDFHGVSDEELYKIAGIEPPKKDVSYGETLYRQGVQQGASFGFGDEITSAIGAGYAKLFGGDTTKDMLLTDLYHEALGKERNAIKSSEEANPKLAFTSDLIGSVAAPVGGFGAAKGISGLAKVGAGAGMLQAAGRSESGTFTDPEGLAKDIAIGGAIGGVAAPAIGSITNKLAAKGRQASEAVGEKLAGSGDVNVTLDLPESGIPDAIKNALAGENQDVVNSFARSLKQGLSPEQAIVKAQADKYGVKLSSGDITQDVTRQGIEDLAAKGVYGKDAQNTAQEFLNSQRESIKGAANKLSSQRFGSELGVNEGDVGQTLQDGLRATAAKEKKAVSGLYKSVDQNATTVNAENLKGLSQNIRTSLEEAQVDIDGIPALSRRLSDLDKIANTEKENLPYYVLENFRKRINNSVTNSPSEQRGINILKRKYDEYVDNLFTNNLVEGDAGALDKIKQARGAFTDYMNRYYGSDGKKFIGKIVDNDWTPEEVVRQVIGVGNLGGKKQSSQAISQIKSVLGAESDEFNQIRLAAFQRLFGDDLQGVLTGNLARNTEGSKFSKNLDNLLRGNKSLANELFSPDEISDMQGLANVISHVTTKQPGAVNYSNTTPVLLRYANSIFDRFGTPGRIAKELTTGKVGDTFNGLKAEKSFSGDLSSIINNKADNVFAKVMGARAAGDVGGNVTQMGAKPQPEPMQQKQYQQPQEPINQQQPNPKKSSIESHIEDAADFAGIERDLLKRIALKESGLNPDAKSKTSSASGLMQFTDKTWRDMVSKYGSETGVRLDDRNDPQASALMGALYAKENKQRLESKLDREPTNGEIYMAHMLGPTGAAKLINSDKNKEAARLFPEAARANRSIFFDGRRARTVKEVRDIISNKI